MYEWKQKNVARRTLVLTLLEMKAAKKGHWRLLGSLRLSDATASVPAL